MRSIFVILVLLVFSFQLFGNDFEYLRDLSYHEYLEIDDPETKLRAYLMHFEPMEKFSGGSTDDLEGWDLEILKEERDMIPAIMKLVDEFEITPNQYINIIGYELYNISFFIKDFFDSGMLTNEEINWFIRSYKEKMGNYLIDYREVNIDLGDFDYFTEYLKNPETDFAKIYGNTSQLSKII